MVSTLEPLLQGRRSPSEQDVEAGPHHAPTPWDVLQAPAWRRLSLADEYALRELLYTVDDLTPQAFVMPPGEEPIKPEETSPATGTPSEERRVQEAAPEGTPAESPGGKPQPQQPEWQQKEQGA
jgi:hypothetical protein